MSKQSSIKNTLTPTNRFSDVITLNGKGFFATLSYSGLSSGVLKTYLGADSDSLQEITDWEITCDTSTNMDQIDRMTNAKYLKFELVGEGEFSASLRATGL